MGRKNPGRISQEGGRAQGAYEKRLQAAIARLGFGEALELLNKSDRPEFEKLSAPTLNRWRSGRKDEEFPKRAELAVKLLETATRSAKDPRLTYAVLPNPASVPLIFLRSLVTELEPSFRDGDVTSIEDRPLAEGESLRIGLGLTVERVKIEDPTINEDATIPEHFLEALVKGEIQLTVAPEITFDKYKDRLRIEIIQLCRIAEAPTIVFRQGAGDPVGKERPYVFVAAHRRNSFAQAERLVKRFREMRISVDDPDPIDSAEDLKAACMKEKKRNIYAFGPTHFLMDAYDRIENESGNPMQAYFEASPERLGVTNWYLYLRKDAFDLGQVALLLRALEQATIDPRRASILSRLQSGSGDRDKEVRKETGLSSAVFKTVCLEEEFRCDSLSPDLIEHLLNAYFGLSS